MTVDAATRAADLARLCELAGHDARVGAYGTDPDTLRVLHRQALRSATDRRKAAIAAIRLAVEDINEANRIMARIGVTP